MKVLFFTSPINRAYLHIGRCGGSSKGGEKWPPVKLMFAAGAVREMAEAMILDAEGRIEESEFMGRVKAFAPDVIVHEPVPATAMLDNSTIKAIKDILPEARSVAMGAYATALGEEALVRFDGIDCVICGEAEDTLREFLVTGAPVAGMWYRSEGKALKHAGQREPIEPLDRLALPAHDLIERGIYATPFSRGRAFTITEMSRDCPYDCSFCNVHLMGGRARRSRSASRMMEELSWVRSLGFEELMFNCPTFTLNKSLVLELCGQLTPLKLGWSCNTRIDLLDDALLEAMSAAGCHTIFIGLESADPEIQRYYRKTLPLERIAPVIRKARAVGIKTLLHAVFGAPMETEKTVQTTIDFLIKADPDYVGINYLTPYRGTDMYDDIKARGLMTTGDDTCLDQSAIASIRAEGMSPEEIDKAVRRAYRAFYFRPAYIMRRLLEIRNIGTLKAYAKGFMRVLSKS